MLVNGTIIALFVKKKELQSPLSVLTGNQCCYGILSNLLNGFLVLVVSLSGCIQPCGPLALPIAPEILQAWGANCTLMILSYLIVPDSSAFQGELQQIILYTSRDLAVDTVSLTLVITFCVASYRLFRKSTINLPEGLTRKMLLLPILMTIMISVVNFCFGILLLATNNAYGGISLENFESSPLYYISQLSSSSLLNMMHLRTLVFSSIWIRSCRLLSPRASSLWHCGFGVHILTRMPWLLNNNFQWLGSKLTLI